MRSLTFVLIAFVVSVGAANADAERLVDRPEWYSCAVSSDCVIVRTICGPTAARRAAARAVKAFWLHSKILCRKPQQDELERAECREGRCQLESPKAKRSG